MKYFVTLVLVSLLIVSCNDSDTIFEELRTEDKLEAAYHFYPSTLRMLNFENDSSINKLVKDIRKLSLLAMNKSTVDLDVLKSYAFELEKDKDYELYLEIDSPEYYCYILGRPGSEETVAFFSQNNQCYVVDVKGQIDFLQLPKAIQSFSEIDSTKTNGYTLLFDMMQSDAKMEERRRKRREKRAEQEAKAETEMPIDTLLKD